ncbi:Mu transposase C-terminal domain-containing protein [Nitrospirillum sp. BR 11164]|uniref:Mu transposase C-terminal domain-containing protein n=1 Tax=Nitrospirillum sp. BR 11164 TaxID=3104324 RepID=UPI002AFE2CEC|nr:Mu transposase C-terminal domain-containing protein [Nitrospirillum sp. BR 11164]MEA1653027.1 Mu transposase C-terminal domain-containing protein [Nitrospirillum sp. BR 11164]
MPDSPTNADAYETVRYRFRKQDRITIGGIEYVPFSTDDQGHVFKRLAAPDVSEGFSHAEIQTLFRTEQIRVDPNWFSTTRASLRTWTNSTLLSELDDKEQAIVLWRQSYCDRFLTLEARDQSISRSDVCMGRSIRQITADLVADALERKGGKKRRCGSSGEESRTPPSPRTLRRWLKVYAASGYDPMSLRTAYQRSGSIDRKSVDATEIAERFAAQYADSRRPTKCMLFLAYETALTDINDARRSQGEPVIESLSRRTFERLINKVTDPFHLCVAREGWKAAKKRFGIVRNGLHILRPLERVEMDEWNVSLMTLLTKAGIWATLTPEQKSMVVRSRTWLGAVIDTATRCFLGLRLFSESPSSATAIATLEMAVSDKTELSQAAGARTPWDMAGTMETIAMDSGAANIAIWTQAAISDLGATAFYPPSGLAEMRARIERSFRTLQTGFTSHFPGQTFENIVRRGEYDSEGNACIDLEELNRTLICWVVDAYHNLPHGGLFGETPRNAWLRLTSKYGVLPPPDRHRQRHIFGIPCERRIQNRGIRVFGIHYQSQQLQQLRRVVGQKPVIVRVDRFDLSSVSVKTKEGWLSVPPAVDGLDLAGVSYWEWIAAAKDLQRQHADTAKLSIPVVRQALAEIRGTADMAMARAELGSPILGTDDFERLDQTLFRTFSFGDGSEGVADEDFLEEPPVTPAEDGYSEEHPTVPLNASDVADDFFA